MRSGKVRVNSFTLLRSFCRRSDERVLVLLGTNTSDTVDIPVVGLDDGQFGESESGCMAKTEVPDMQRAFEGIWVDVSRYHTGGESPVTCFGPPA
jgi:hypothetical protein